MNKNSSTFPAILTLLLIAILLAACSSAPATPQPAAVAPTAEEIPPTAAPTETAVPTNTPVPPTATLDPTATDEPTATPVPPTETPPPTATTLPPLSASGGGVIAYVSEESGVPGIYVMNADGTEQRQMTESFDDHPTWSPDGQQIAYTGRTNDGWGLYVVDLLSGETRPVKVRTDDGASANAPDWSPDGKRFAVSFSDGGAYQISLMNAGGGPFRGIHDYPIFADFDMADWSPDGAQLAFHSDLEDDDDFEIYISDINGANVVKLTPHQAWERSAAWSPDGSKIAFETNLDGNWEIYTINVDGSGPQNISNNPVHREWYPTWSPDGSKIAFQTDRDGNWEIYVMNADGTDVQRLTDNEVKDGAPAWRP